jgi:hypothetical protein
MSQTSFFLRGRHVLFLSVFFAFFNTFSVNHEQLLYGYFISLFLIAFYFLCSLRIFNFQILFFVIFVCFVLLYSLHNPASINEQVSFLFLLLPIFIIPWRFSSEQISNAVIKASFCALLIFSILFFMGIGVNYSYGFPRMHGLMSEPSAIAFPATLVFLTGLVFFRKIYILIGFGALLLSGSLVSIVVSFSSLLLFFIINHKSIVLKIFFSFISLGLVLIASEIVFAFASYNSTLSRLAPGLESVFSLGASGYNPRLEHAVYVYDFLNKQEALLFGLGLNAAEVINISDHGIRRSFSFPVEFVFSFGVAGFFGLTFLTFCALFLSDEKKVVKVCFVSLLCYCWINSAMGITLQVFYLALFISILRNIFRSRVRSATLSGVPV